MNTPKKRIGILIVAYNAATTLVQTLERVPGDVWEDIEEIAVFDDASHDDTYEIALEKKNDSGQNKLTIFKNPVNLGYGGNQMAGYKYFIDKGFDAVVLLHGDGQYAPEILDHMYAPVVEGKADAVFGSRMMMDYGGPLKGGMPLYKYVGNRILSVFENTLLNMNLTEFHSGYRAYNLHALAQIDFSEMTHDFHFDTEIIIKLQHQGFAIHEVPIPTYYGDEICYVNGMKYAKDVVRAVFRYKLTTGGMQVYPEFSEYTEHYPIKRSKHSSHDYIRQLLGEGEDVLDLGCGEGYFADSVAEKGNRFFGVDILDQPEKRDALAEYVCADLNAGLEGVLPTIGSQKFDRVLMQDILEHLYAPERLLQDARLVLKPGGEVLVSLPNVANISVRLALLFGQFNYTERGILDKTHLRFFTRKSARKLLEDNGYTIVEQKTTVIPMELVLRVPPENRFMRFVNGVLAGLTRLMPGLFGYQFVFVARPVDEAERLLERERKAKTTA